MVPLSTKLGSRSPGRTPPVVDVHRRPRAISVLVLTQSKVQYLDVIADAVEKISHGPKEAGHIW